MAAAATQQPAASYLPSLVLFGRCLLQWAGQLQQHAQELLQGHGDLQQTNEGLLCEYDYSAARMCIPVLREGSTIKPGERLESLAATVSEWVGGLDCELTQTQLGAAGCLPQQLQQQLDALLSAQQGTQQRLTDALLAPLVQQLQQHGLYKPQWSHRGAVGVRAQLHMCRVPDSALLWTCLSAGSLEATQARVQGAGRGCCNRSNSTRVITRRR